MGKTVEIREGMSALCDRVKTSKTCWVTIGTRNQNGKATMRKAMKQMIRAIMFLLFILLSSLFRMGMKM